MNEVTDARASVTSAYFNYCIFAEESKRRVKSRMTVTRLKHPVSPCFTSVTVCNVG